MKQVRGLWYVVVEEEQMEEACSWTSTPCEDDEARWEKTVAVTEVDWSGVSMFKVDD